MEVFLELPSARDQDSGALCCAHVPRLRPAACASSFTSLRRTPRCPDRPTSLLFDRTQTPCPAMALTRATPSCEWVRAEKSAPLALGVGGTKVRIRTLSRVAAISAIAFLLCDGSRAAGVDDSDAATAGRALYRGTVALSAPVQLAGVALPGAARAMTACVSCHGARGEGRLEAGVQVPPLTWRALMQPTGSRPAYRDPAQVLAAVMHGTGRGGDKLQAPMPQFALNAAEQQALLAYLERIGTEVDPAPGVFADRIVVASVLPLSGRATSVGERVRAALAAQFDEQNRRGGVYGRDIELRVVDGGSDATSASRAARELIESGEVLALVASLLPDPDAGLRTALTDHGVPMVATLGVAFHGKRVGRLTYLLPDLQRQVRLLAAEMARRCPGDGAAAITVLHGAGLPLDPADPSAAGAALRWLAVTADQTDFSSPQRSESARLISLLPAWQHEALKRHLSVQSNRAESGCLGTLAVATAPTEGAELSGWHEVVALPMPMPPPGTQAPSGADTWTVLGDSAARVLIEALSRSGRQLDPERLAAAVQSLNRFAPQPGLTLSFDAGRTSGFDPEFVWR